MHQLRTSADIQKERMLEEIREISPVMVLIGNHPIRLKSMADNETLQVVRVHQKVSHPIYVCSLGTFKSQKRRKGK